MKTATALLCFSFTLFGFGMDRVISYDDLRTTYFGSIQQIQEHGSWQNQKGPGKFRIIRAQLFGQDMLFIDLVQLSPDQTEWKVVRGFTIPELNSDHAETELVTVTPRQDGDQHLLVDASITTSHNPKKKRLRIRVDAEKQEITVSTDVM